MDNRTARRRIRRAFRELRKDGLLAEECLACCTTCATYEIAQAINAQKALGGVYWHSQDEDDFRRHGLPLMLGFVDGSASAVEVGKRVVLALEAAGLKTRWNESTKTKIMIAG